MNLVEFIDKRNALVASFVTGEITYDDFSTSITTLNMEAVEKGLNSKFILTPDKLAAKEEANSVDKEEIGEDYTEDESEEDNYDYDDSSSS